MTDAEKLAAEILALFEVDKLNTNEIAKRLQMKEPDVVFLKQQAMEARQENE